MVRPAHQSHSGWLTRDKEISYSISKTQFEALKVDYKIEIK
jgi:hypothetical protein